MRIAIALVHHPVLDRDGDVVTTAMTNLDLHDMSRSARTYGAFAMFVTHPIEAQRELVARIRDHWVEGSGKKRIPDRARALELVRTTITLDEAIEACGGRAAVEVWTTAAAARGRAITTFADARARLEKTDKTVLLVFGTGWGLAPSVVDAADVHLEPIHGAPGSDFNHLSVRAACAIALDRLVG
ncbi:MAG: RNA methyltransferase [Polyangiaceae bacterium]|nr:RNA methyltransferase [Polyangiaceae bacterium]